MFYKCVFKKARDLTLVRSPQRLVAAERAIAKDKEQVGLFPELVKFQTAEERIASAEKELAQWSQRQRDLKAACWRKARKKLNKLPPLTRAGLLKYWQDESIWTPREPNYLLDEIHGILHRGENPWRRLRIRRQAILLGLGRLPKSVALSMQAWPIV